jgi:hypothetical protein
MFRGRRSWHTWNIDNIRNRRSTTYATKHILRYSPSPKRRICNRSMTYTGTYSPTSERSTGSTRWSNNIRRRTTAT